MDERYRSGYRRQPAKRPDVKRVGLRLSPELHERLERRAGQQRRSLHAQIVYELERAPDDQ